MNRPAVRIVVEDSSQTAEARRVATGVAGVLGFNETEIGKIAIVATEAATNIVKHAKGGEILVRVLESDGLELLALDRGPGMANVALCLQDGYSTAGSSGNGLGAMARLSSELNIYSSEKGTMISARFVRGGSTEEPFEADGFSVPYPGEQVSGDSWGMRQVGPALLILVVDGLGHGRLAADAADVAVETFLNDKSDAPAQALEQVHRALRSTRGAAGSVVRIDPGHDLLVAGIGNISAVICSGTETRHTVSLNGVLGHEARQIREFTSPWTSHSLLVMHSDGLQTRWDLNAYPGLIARQPGLIAAALYRDWSRGRDDATVVVVRERRRE